MLYRCTKVQRATTWRGFCRALAVVTQEATDASSVVTQEATDASSVVTQEATDASSVVTQEAADKDSMSNYTSCSV